MIVDAEHFDLTAMSEKQRFNTAPRCPYECLVLLQNLIYFTGPDSALNICHFRLQLKLIVT